MVGLRSARKLYLQVVFLVLAIFNVPGSLSSSRSLDSVGIRSGGGLLLSDSAVTPSSSWLSPLWVW